MRYTFRKIRPNVLGSVSLLVAGLGCGGSETYILPAPFDTAIETSELQPGQLGEETAGLEGAEGVDDPAGGGADSPAAEEQNRGQLDEEEEVASADPELGNNTSSGEAIKYDPTRSFPKPWLTDPLPRGPSANPLYAFASKLQSQSGIVNFVFLTDNLSTDLEISDAVLSIEGAPVLVVGPERGGTIYLAASGKMLTRYDIDSSGQLQLWGEPLSFKEAVSAQGFGEYGSSFQFIRPNRAYYFSPYRMVLWDPSAMVIDGSVSYGDGPEKGGLFREGYSTTFSALPLNRGSDLYVAAGWHLGGVILPETGLLIVNKTTDEVKVVTDSRCAYAREGAWGSDGKLYLASDAYAAAVYFMDSSKALAPCMIRYDPATGQFDPDFLEQQIFGVNSSTGSPLDTAFGSLQAGPGGSAFLRILDPELGLVPTEGARFLSSADRVWHWAKIDLSSSISVSILDVPPSGGSAVPFVFGDRIFSPSFSFEQLFPDGDGYRVATSTQMVELTAQGPSPSRFSFPGQSFSAVTVR